MFLFIKNSCVFVASSLVFIFVYFLTVYHAEFPDKIYGYEVYHSIKKSLQKKTNTNVLILGDSVAKQLYDNNDYNDSIYSLACNQAISVAGQYFLLHNFLSKHEDKEKLDIILIYLPLSFNNNLDQKYTFQYFVKPFYNDAYLPLMTNDCKKQIEKIPFYNWSQNKVIKESNWSPNFPNPKIKFDISEISRDYLIKMDSLCQEENVNSFKIYCPPISSSVNEADLEYFKVKVDELNLSDLFDSYFDGLVRLNENQFNADQIHFLTNNIPSDFLNLSTAY